MTGKTQKAEQLKEEFMQAVQITEEEKVKIMNESVAEVHGANADMLDSMNISLTVFRGGFLLHTLYGQILESINNKMNDLLVKKAEAYRVASEQKKRR
jgi:hypothetical protein